MCTHKTRLALRCKQGLAVHDARLVVHDVRLAVHDVRLTVHDVRLAVHDVALVVYDVGLRVSDAWPITNAWLVAQESRLVALWLWLERCSNDGWMRSGLHCQLVRRWSLKHGQLVDGNGAPVRSPPIQDDATRRAFTSDDTTKSEIEYTAATGICLLTESNCIIDMRDFIYLCHNKIT